MFKEYRYQAAKAPWSTRRAFKVHFPKKFSEKQTFSEECYSWVLEADEKYEALDNAHDTGYKYLLEIKKIFVQLMRSFVKQGWAQKIDEDSVEKINKTFITQNFKKKEADIVYKVKLMGRKYFFTFY